MNHSPLGESASKGRRGAIRWPEARTLHCVEEPFPAAPASDPPASRSYRFTVGQDLSWQSKRIACAIARTGPGLRLFQNRVKRLSLKVYDLQAGG
jgi:hypothetical protein